MPPAAPPGGGSRSLLDRLLAGRLVLRRELDLKAFELLLKLVGYIVLRSTLLVTEVTGITELQQSGTLVVALDLERSPLENLKLLV